MSQVKLSDGQQALNALFPVLRDAKLTGDQHDNIKLCVQMIAKELAELVSLKTPKEEVKAPLAAVPQPQEEAKSPA